MWPEYVIRSFHAINSPICNVSHFHGPYFKLLWYCFPPNTEFTPIPHPLKAASQPRDSIEFIVNRAVSVPLENKPVLIVQLKNPAAIQHISTRAEADDQIRRRIIDLAERCPLRTLHAVSALGTKLSFYSLDLKNRAAGIDPPRIDRDPVLVNDYAPAERWNCDILEASGEEKLLAVINEIKAGFSRKK
jgi:hypothetical protein